MPTSSQLYGFIPGVPLWVCILLVICGGFSFLYTRGYKRAIAGSITVIALLACFHPPLASVTQELRPSDGGRAQPEPEEYRVVGFESKTSEWKILRTGTADGRSIRERIIVVCNFYADGSKDVISYGPSACHLQIGKLLVPTTNVAGNYGLKVYDKPARGSFQIQERIGSTTVVQEFQVIKRDLLDEAANP